ncbi:glycosyltransferase N-terminal domain-containing protein [Hyphomonas sp. FCG-A18]|uniref:3-deoxy-D-manno-octulosonic acid transferase n=1 Tax=Hyphomonas sp. FCG-A18 TaxID=3080019 RepID=UPI002B2A6ED5|nr:glycosyltransferase N-terminal domain-containing protein [Hyphomonas sp. FCG-A18]
MRIGLFLYRMVTRLIAPLLPVLMRRRVARDKEDPNTLSQRFARNLPDRPDGPLIWMHGASVGESKLLLLVADALQERRPDLTILHTCQTLTGATLIKTDIATKTNRIFCPAPLDTPATAKRFANHWSPELAVFAEGEIWPNLLTQLRQSGTRTALINARMTQNSLNTWARWPATARKILGGFDIIAASSHDIAKTLKALAPQTTHLPANLKTSLPPLSVEESELTALKTAIGERPILLAASTHPGEETLVLNALKAMSLSPFLILAPRHPERGDEVEQLCHTHKHTVARRSFGTEVNADTNILLADTMGEMGLWMHLAHWVYLGGGHTPGIGGHNPLEAIRLGKPVLTGRDVFNFSSMMEDLEQRGGLHFVSDATALAEALPVSAPPQALMDHLEATAQDPLQATLAALLPLLSVEETSHA